MVVILRTFLSLALVAPVRERGLKYPYDRVVLIDDGRSRKGAWIEIGRENQGDSRWSSLP